MPPPNDAFANATVLSGSRGAEFASNVGATLEAGEPAVDTPGDGATGDASIWFAWTAEDNGTLNITPVVTFDTFGSRRAAGDTLDTVLDVWTGPDLAGLTLVAVNDDEWSGPDPPSPDTGGVTSRVNFACTPGVTYYLRVNGYWPGQEGSVQLHWSENVHRWGPNLLSGDNETFEAGTGDWEYPNGTGAAITRSTAEAHGGVASLAETTSTTTAPPPTSSTSVWAKLSGLVVATLRVLRLRAWVKANTGTSPFFTDHFDYPDGSLFGQGPWLGGINVAHVVGGTVLDDASAGSGLHVALAMGASNLLRFPTPVMAVEVEVLAAVGAPGPCVSGYEVAGDVQFAYGTYDHATGRYEIGAYVNGTVTVLATLTASAPVVPYRLRLEHLRKEFSLYLDDVLTLTATDTVGVVGAYPGLSTSAVGDQIDNFKVWSVLVPVQLVIEYPTASTTWFYGDTQYVAADGEWHLLEMLSDDPLPSDGRTDAALYLLAEVDSTITAYFDDIDFRQLLPVGLSAPLQIRRTDGLGESNIAAMRPSRGDPSGLTIGRTP